MSLYRINARELWVNLSHIVCIAKDGRDRYEATMSDGCTVVLDSHDIDAIEFLAAPVVPARSGDSVLIVSCFDGGDHMVSEQPIVAWRMIDTTAEPVLVEEPGGNEVIGIPMPDGTVLQPHETTYQNRQEFIASALEALRGRKSCSA